MKIVEPVRCVTVSTSSYRCTFMARTHYMNIARGHAPLGKVQSGMDSQRYCFNNLEDKCNYYSEEME